MTCVEKLKRKLENAEPGKGNRKCLLRLERCLALSVVREYGLRQLVDQLGQQNREIAKAVEKMCELLTRWDCAVDDRMRAIANEVIGPEWESMVQEIVDTSIDDAEIRYRLCQLMEDRRDHGE